MKIPEKIKKKLTNPIIVYIALGFLLYFLVLWNYIGQNTGNVYDYKVGDIVTEDIIVKKDITYIDEQTTNKNREQYLNTLPPVYTLYEKNYFDTQLSWDNIINYIEKNREQINSGDRSLIQFFKDKKIIDPVFKQFALDISSSKDMYEHFMGFVETVYSNGITDKKFSELPANEEGMIKINWQRSSQLVVKQDLISNVFYKENQDKNMVTLFQDFFPAYKTDDVKKILPYLLTTFTENIFFDSGTTYKELETAKKNFIPVTNVLKKGKIIVRRGQEVSAQDLKLISILNQYANTIEFKYIFIHFLLYILLMGLSFFLMREISHKFIAKLKNIFFIYFMLILIFTFTVISLYFSGSITLNPFLFIPFALFNFLILLIFPIKIVFSLNIIFSLFYFLVSDFNFMGFFYSVLLNFLFITVKQNDLKVKRSVYYRSVMNFFFTLFYTLILFFQGMFPQTKIGTIFLFSFINSFLSSILFFGFMPIVEYIFNYATPYKLIELSDLNNQIFNELLVKAPGTYHHSIVVANFAQNAALACNANPYIAKVGGLYHDIGKMRYAKYFIENQNSIFDDKDKLNVSMAVTLIKNHVKTGIELAKKMKLPEEIINIINEHHGKTTMVYFYQLALEQNPNTKKEEFSYDFPKPTSKESAIVMLADSIEAATRTITNPNFNVIQNTVKNIINDRFLSGQLDESPLTLSDLKLIEKSMIENVMAMVHKRIDYPDKEDIRKLEKKIKSRNARKKVD